MIRPLCFLIVVLAGCGDRSQPAGLMVGHVVSKSGLDKEAGEAAERGIRLAVEDANKDTAAKPIKVIHTETLGKLEAFESQAVRLVTVNRVAALLGGTTAEEAERLDRARVPVVTLAGMGTPATSDAVFFTGLSPALQGKTLARFALNDLKATRVLLLPDERREDSLNAAEAFEREFISAAGKDDKSKAQPPVPLRFGKEIKLTDLAWQIRAQDKPSAILFAGGASDLRDLRTELADEVTPILFAGDLNNRRALQAHAGTRGRVYMLLPFVAGAEPARAKEFAKRYKDAYGDEAGIHAAVAYDASRLLFDGLRRGQEHASGNRLRDDLAGLKDFPGLTGPLSFGEDRRLRRAAFIVHVEEGKSKTVKRVGPEE
jgi:branched-chain amino acid transport system substrate-binding protein